MANKIVIILIVCWSMGFTSLGDIAKIGVVVLDAGSLKPMADVPVRGVFSVNNGWMAWKGGAEPNIDKGMTDVNGMCRLRGRTNCGRVGCWVKEPPSGYYVPYNGVGQRFHSKNLLGIWQPDNLVVTIRLQRVEHPIPLFVKYVSNASPVSGSRDIFPKGEDTVRYDLVMGDWLPPVGSGKVADVEFTRHPRKTLYEIEIQKFGEKKKYEAYRDSMTVNFLGKDNGLMELHPPPDLGLRIRTAPGTGYSSTYESWHQTDFVDGSFVTRKVTKSYDENRCFCFRIRTRHDASGKIVEAYYGKIYGDIYFSWGVSNVCMLYYLNLTPLDRNLEWDRKTNLNPEKRRMGYEYQNNCRP